MTDFISDNPALTSYFGTRNNLRAQDEGDIQLRGARQTEGANNAIDAGLRSWFQNGGQQPATQAPAPPPTQAPDAPPMQAPMPPPTQDPSAAPAAAAPRQSPLAAIGTSSAAPSNPVDPYSGAYAEIAKTPGTGRALAQMSSAGVQRKQDMTFQMFDAMDKGDLPKAQYLAQTVGFNLPPQAWNDVRTIRLIGQAKYFHDAYKDDPQGFGTFLQTAMRGADQNGGVPDWQGALKASPPRAKGQVNYEGFQATTGHAPSDEQAGTMFGAGRPIAPSFGTTVIAGDDGSPQVATVNRRNGVVTPTGQAATTRTPGTVGTTTVETENGPQVITYDRRTGKPVGTLGAAKPGNGSTQGDKDWTAATNAVNNDPTFMGKPAADRDAEIQRRYDALKGGRERNNTGQRKPPSVTSGPATTEPASAQPAQANHAGTQDDPHQPQSPQDWQSLPTGAVYRDPGDGQLYRKP